MAGFGCTGVVLKENTVTNSSFNKAMTNSSLTSSHSTQADGYKQKRSSLPDIFSSTAGRAKSFLKRFSSSFVTSRSSRSLSPSHSKAKHTVSLSHKCSIDENKSLLPKDKVSLNEKFWGNFDILDKNPIDSLLPTKWPHQEITKFPKKCGHPSSARDNNFRKCLDFKSRFHSSRKLKYDQDSEGICAKKTRIVENEDNDASMKGESAAATSKHCLSITWSSSGACQQQMEHIACRVQTLFSTTESRETSCSTLKTPLENVSSPIKDYDLETLPFKPLRSDGSLCNGNMYNSEATAQITMGSPIEQLKTDFHDEERKCISSKFKMEHSGLDIKPKSLRMKVTKSLLFLPYPKIPFKVKAVQPLNIPFEVFYCPFSMIPIVRTAGEIFEAHLQEIILDSKGQERFRNSTCKFKCSIKVESCDPANKFEEIKRALRDISSAYNIGRQDCLNTSTQVSIKARSGGNIEKVEPTSFKSYDTCLPVLHCSTTSNKELYPPQVMQCDSPASNVNFDCASINVPTCCNEKVANNSRARDDLNSNLDNEVSNILADAERDSSHTPLRRSSRKVKRGLWEGRNAYATKITRPISSQIDQVQGNVSVGFTNDKTYLGRRFIVNQLVQDITGVPVVVLERLSTDVIEKIINH